MRRCWDISPRPKAEISGVQKPLRSTADTAPFTITVPPLRVSVPVFMTTVPVYVFKPFRVNVPACTLPASLYAIEPFKVTVPVFEPAKVNIPPLVFITLPVLLTVLE